MFDLIIFLLIFWHYFFTFIYFSSTLLLALLNEDLWIFLSLAWMKRQFSFVFLSPCVCFISFAFSLNLFICFCYLVDCYFSTNLLESYYIRQVISSAFSLHKTIIVHIRYLLLRNYYYLFICYIIHQFDSLKISIKNLKKLHLKKSQKINIDPLL